eukprot:1196187-Prorocentrum_minimum.AAC.5
MMRLSFKLTQVAIASLQPRYSSRSSCVRYLGAGWGDLGADGTSEHRNWRSPQLGCYKKYKYVVVLRAPHHAHASSIKTVGFRTHVAREFDWARIEGLRTPGSTDNCVHCMSVKIVDTHGSTHFIFQRRLRSHPTAIAGAVTICLASFDADCFYFQSVGTMKAGPNSLSGRYKIQ